ncbi:MAG TPA: hypothetical protein VF423_12015 [Actinomycetes bacterium]
MVRLGAWCDVETEDEARQRLLAGAAKGDDRPPADHGHPGPRPGRFVPLRFALAAGMPVQDPGGIRFRVEEFAVLAGGRRIRLHSERGFTLSAVRGDGVSSGLDPWQGLTLESLESDVRTTVLPDDAEDTGEDHPWEWLSELLRVQGIEASAEQLRDVPYDVEFSDRLHRRVPAGA